MKHLVMLALLMLWTLTWQKLLGEAYANTVVDADVNVDSTERAVVAVSSDVFLGQDAGGGDDVDVKAVILEPLLTTQQGNAAFLATTAVLWRTGGMVGRRSALWAIPMVGLGALGVWTVHRFGQVLQPSLSMGTFSLETGHEEHSLRFSQDPSFVFKEAAASSPKRPLPPPVSDVSDDDLQSSESQASSEDGTLENRLKQLEQIYTSLAIEDLRERLRSFVLPRNLHHILPQQLWQDFLHFARTLRVEKDSSSCGKNVSTRYRYLFLSKIIKKDRRSFSQWAVILGCSTARVRGDWRKIKGFLAQYAPVSLEPHTLISDHSPASTPSSPGASGSYSGMSKPEDHSNDLVETLKSRYFQLDAMELQQLLKPYMNHVELANVEPGALLTYLESVLTPPGMYFFLGDILQLQEGAYDRMLIKHHSRQKAGEELRTILKNLKWQYVHDRSTQHVLSGLKSLFASLPHPNVDIEPVLSSYYIAEQDRELFVSLLKSMATRYENTRTTSLKAFMFYRKILGYPYLPATYSDIMRQFWSLSLLDSKKGQRSSHSYKNMADAIKEDLVKDLHMAAVTLWREYPSLEALRTHQELMLKIFVREESRFVSRDYRWQHASHDDLAKRLGRFWSSRQELKADTTNVILLYAALGIPKISLQHLSALLDLPQEEVEERSRWLHQLWQQEDKVVSVHPASYDVLEERFWDLSEKHWIYLRDMLFPPGTDVRDAIHSSQRFFSQDLMTPLKRHVFLSLVLKMEHPSRLISQHMLELYNSADVSQRSFLSSMRATMKHMTLDFQKKILEGNKEVRTVQSSEDFHQLMVDIYRELSDEDIQYVAKKWGYLSLSEREQFHTRLVSLADHLLTDKPKNFDILISRVLHLAPIAMTRVADVNDEASDVSAHSKEKKIIWRLRCYLAAGDCDDDLIPPPS